MRRSPPLLIALSLAATSPALGTTFDFAARPAIASVPVAAEAQIAVSAAPIAAPAAARPTHAKGDPWERFNRSMFNFFQKIDRAVFRPVALGLGKVIPKPIRDGLRNFLSNVNEPIVFMNDLLQLKPKRALRTLGRFTLNTAVGLGGLADVAKLAKLPHRNNTLGNTLARYGVGPGPYIFLPFLGPSTLRDFGGEQTDQIVLPLAVGKPFNRLDWQLATAGFSGLNQRIESDEDLRTLLSGAADPYATLRSVYLQSRLAEIAEIKGKPSAAPATFDDPLDDPALQENTVPPDPAAPEAPVDPQVEALPPSP